MTEPQEKVPNEPLLDYRVRPLLVGEIICVYLELDRRANPEWSNAQYLLKFGEAVSIATVKANMRYNASLSGASREG